jgi:hypothetical protein
MQRLERAAIFGRPELVWAWFRAVTSNPIAYLKHRLMHMAAFLGGAHLPKDLWSFGNRTTSSDHRLLGALVTMGEALQSTLLFRNGFWLAAAIAVLLIGWRDRATPPGSYAVAVATTAIVYMATFSLVGVASAFRYGHWTVLASLTGAVVALAGHRRASTAKGGPAV